MRDFPIILHHTGRGRGEVAFFSGGRAYFTRSHFVDEVITKIQVTSLRSALRFSALVDAYVTGLNLR